jgi:hypothetical protein
MGEIAPEGDAGGTRPELLASAVGRLLDPAVWAAAAETSAGRAGTYSPETFRVAVRDAVADLLPGAS